MEIIYYEKRRGESQNICIKINLYFDCIFHKPQVFTFHLKEALCGFCSISELSVALLRLLPDCGGAVIDHLMTTRWLMVAQYIQHGTWTKRWLTCQVGRARQREIYDGILEFRMAQHLKLLNCLFPFNNLTLWFTECNQNHRMQNHK